MSDQMYVREKVELKDAAARVMEALPGGILLNTQGEKFNSMVIAWGSIGTNWRVPAFTVYVREHRYTKGVLDATGEFTISVPEGKPDPVINQVCGFRSGRDVDKVSAAGLTLVPGEKVSVPGVAEYPLTIECKVLYAQPQELSKLPEEILTVMYPQDMDWTEPIVNRDAHTTYIGQIVDAYVIRKK